MRAPTLVLTLLALTGACVSTGGYRRHVELWRGEDANKLVRRWGPPDRTFNMPNGNVQYVYSEGGTVQIAPSRSVGTVESIPGGSATVETERHQALVGTLWCVTRFEVRESTVVDVDFEGNHCVR